MAGQMVAHGAGDGIEPARAGIGRVEIRARRIQPAPVRVAAKLGKPNSCIKNFEACTIRLYLWNDTGLAFGPRRVIAGGTCPSPYPLPAPVQAWPVQRAGRGMKGEGAWTFYATSGETGQDE